jgi:hypothetical protein
MVRICDGTGTASTRPAIASTTAAPLGSTAERQMATLKIKKPKK